MTASEATRLARQVVADLTGADDATKRLGPVTLRLADEVDRLAGVVDRLVRQAGAQGVSLRPLLPTSSNDEDYCCKDDQTDTD